VILAFGDSLTYGNGARQDESYPAVLQRLTGRKVINAGVPGEQSDAGLKRLPHVLNKYHPQLLILCHGGNDMLRHKSIAAMESNLRRMITISRERNVPVVLIGVPQPAIFGLKSAYPYVTLAKEMELPVEVNIIPEVLSDTNLKSDQIHPNAEGYKKIAEALFQILQRSGAL